ncbi:MAG: putative addiction module killer protein [Chlamydiales bacterium]|jgi:putative addiction module killer protein
MSPMCYNKAVEEEIAIEIYESDIGKCPYLEWERALTREVRAHVRKRLNRVRLGNFGDHKSLEGEKGLYELRMHFGSGFRVYFGKKGNRVVILLCGGDKGSQRRDIAKAKKYWGDCP